MLVKVTKTEKCHWRGGNSRTRGPGERETLGIERSEQVESKTIGKRWEMRKQS